MKNLAAFIALMLLGTSLSAQCTNWTQIERKGEAEDAHVVYRPYLKGKTVDDLVAMSDADFTLAFTNWEKAYTLAPAADGQRPTHYIDGIMLYQAKIRKTEDDTQKTEMARTIVKMYDEYLECYPDDKKLITGRKAFDMFYSPAYGYSLESLEAVKTAINLGGNESEYILLDPLGQLLVYLYENKQIDKATVRDLYTKAINFANHNIENGHVYKTYYESGKANMEASVAKIASEIFDCAFFKDDLLPKFAANKDDWDSVNYIWLKLKQQGCEEEDADLAELKTTWETMKRARERENPCTDGYYLQQEGKYDEALARYQECVESTDDKDTKAQVLFSMASILVWQKGQLSAGESKAREAASMKSGWGKPYMLMGDIISKRASGCGDDWERRLAAIAAIDKYSYARSIDSDVAGDAGKRIGNLSAALPARQDGFMRGVSEGQSVNVGCIGETVKVRYRD